MLIGDTALARIFRFSPCYAPDVDGEGELSYDAQLQADVAAGFKEAETAAAAAPADPAQETPADPEPDAAADPGPKADALGRLHAKDGKFVPKSGAKASDPGSDAQGQPTDPVDPAAAAKPIVQPGADPAADPAAAPSVANPPTSWAVAAKAEWDKLPALVKDAIAKREVEMAQGQERYRTELGELNEVRPFNEMAKRSGTTLATALQNYTNIEATLNENPHQGLMAVCKNLGMSKAQAAETFAQLAQHLGARVPAGQNGGQGHQDQTDDDPLMEVLGPMIQKAVTPFQQQTEQLTQFIQSMQSANQTAAASAVVEVLAAMQAEPEFRYLGELEHDINHLFTTGAVARTGNHRADITKAYRMAAAAHPEISTALSSMRVAETDVQRRQREADAAAKAAKASRSITGSATDGAAPAAKNTRREGMSYAQDLEADVRAAAGLS